MRQKFCVTGVFEIRPFLQNRFGDGSGTEGVSQSLLNQLHTALQNLHHIVRIRQTGVSKFHRVTERVGQDRQRIRTAIHRLCRVINNHIRQVKWQKTWISDHTHGDGIPQVIPRLLHHFWSDTRRIATGNYDWSINHL